MPPTPAPTVLNPAQALSVQLIAQGMTRKHVAAQLGIDPGTLSRWRRLPAFQQELAKLLDQSEREAVESFRAVKLMAVERLASLLSSPTPMVALKAVDMVLSRTDLSSKAAASTDSYQQRSDAQFDKILDELLAA